jgi:2-polyprenyl-3-methyl-5-hydroxy-6-metoxy-1,4-benzoquinol methylase
MDRRTGDRIAIDGAYQYEAFHSGSAPQRFWHWAKYTEALRLLAPRSGERLLDVGCGSGVLADLMAADEDVSVLAVDGNDAAIAFACERFRRPNLEFRRGLVDELDLPPGSFDGIAFLEVIEHVTEAQARAVLRTFHRLLKPGGRLVVSTPNRRSLWPLIEWVMDTLRLAPHMDEDQHDRLYDRTALAAMAAECGFHVRNQITVNTLAPWLSWLGRGLARRVHRWEVRRLRRAGSILLFCFAKAGAAQASTATPG